MEQTVKIDPAPIASDLLRAHLPLPYFKPELIPPAPYSRPAPHQPPKPRTGSSSSVFIRTSLLRHNQRHSKYGLKLEWLGLWVDGKRESFCDDQAPLSTFWIQLLIVDSVHRELVKDGVVLRFGVPRQRNGSVKTRVAVPEIIVSPHKLPGLYTEALLEIEVRIFEELQ